MSSTPNSLTIVNTSPLLYLHQIGQIDLLMKLYSQITVPTAVQQELEVGKAKGINVPNLTTFDWVRVASVISKTLLPNIIDLGRGEAEVIALGLQYSGSLLILDDQLGRRIALLYNQKCTGTIGILIKAKQLGYLTNVSSLIQQLQSQGMWLTEPLIQNALKLAGELDNS
jgi:predicted nucleic acid-binding protein